MSRLPERGVVKFEAMRIRIKNMVCRHCVAKVAEVASSIPGIELRGVRLGSIDVEGTPTENEIDMLDSRLKEEGFEVIHSREESITAEIKGKLQELSRSGEGLHADIASCLEDALHLSFRTLSRTFASAEGRTIENYFTALRIERIKELLLDGELTLSEIAYVTGFSSVPHLSSRFKQATGMTPTQFRSVGQRTLLPDV